VSENNLEEDVLLGLCMKSKEEMTEEMKGAWCKIAEELPFRSVQSIHNFCKRRFNPNNYSGKWTEDEERKLFDLIDKYGHKWKDIANHLNTIFFDGDEIDIDGGKKNGRTP
jgi:hypothetical protein